MGQAQLLLLVLGVVLVGIAIVAGIQAYETNNKKASLDAQVHDAIRIASDVQTWAQKPPQFGGPPAANYADVGLADFDQIGYGDANSATEWTNINGTYTLSDATANTNKTITSVNGELETKVQAIVCGINDEDIIVDTAQGEDDPSAECPTL